MNERIRELANQAHLVADATYARGPDSIWEREYNKKFVELIVRECVKCCEEVADINKTYIEERFVDPEFGPKECIEVIKKHFGVEE